MQNARIANRGGGRRRPKRTALLAGTAALIVGLMTDPAAGPGTGLGIGEAHAAGADSAVALIYHRFGEDDHPSTNVRKAQFEKHVELLASDAYTVLPVSEILARIDAGEPLPARAVAITVDDAYLSVYETAWPLLKKHDLPFSLFVATDPVDRGIPGYMTWDQIRQLAAAGVEIGSQAVTHPHMPGQSQAAIDRELQQSAARLASELGERPTLFAYPYGEASNRIKARTEMAGYAAAFGQHSGAINRHSDRYYLPRFPVNEAYGGMDRFKRVVETLPLNATELTPDDPFIDADTPGGNPPPLGFTLAEPLESPDSLACYRSDTGRVKGLNKLGLRVEVRFDRPFGPGRTRVNCTAPTPEGRWRWFGMQYYVAE